jgi:enoyl-CoA hydratase/carnithine racemase
VSEPNVLVRIDARQAGARVAYLTINREHKLNALNSAVMRDFVTACEELEQDEQLRAVVSTGAGDKAFVGGADIDEMADLDADSGRAFITLVHRACRAVRKLPVPVIARIQGYALGAGLELAAACDLRVAADTAIFGMPEVKLGLPSVVEAALLPTLIGWGRTRELVLLGESYTASEAATWGLVERVVPKMELDMAVERWVDSLVEAGPRAVRLQKALVRAWETLPLAAAIETGIESFVAAWQSEEPGRALGAFRAARKTKNQ